MSFNLNTSYFEYKTMIELCHIELYSKEKDSNFNISNCVNPIAGQKVEVVKLKVIEAWKNLESAIHSSSPPFFAPDFCHLFSCPKHLLRKQIFLKREVFFWKASIVMAMQYRIADRRTSRDFWNDFGIFVWFDILAWHPVFLFVYFFA